MDFTIAFAVVAFCSLRATWQFLALLTGARAQCRNGAGNLSGRCCSYRRSNPDVVMMESSEQRDGLNAANRWRGAVDRCILAEREVGPDLIVIVGIGPQHIPEMPFANYRPIGESDSSCGRHSWLSAANMRVGRSYT
jgi:hypothetical protein